MSKEYEPETVADLTDMVNSSLHLWYMGPKASARLINLSENATFIASDPDTGKEIVIRVQRTGYSSEEAIRSEITWIKALCDDKVIDTASPILNTNGDYVAQTVSKKGEHRMVVAFEKLAGSEPNLELDGLEHWFEVLGEITAKMHIQSRSWNRPYWFTRRVWDYDGIVGKNAFWGSWRDSINLSNEGAVYIEKTLEKVKSIMDEYGIDSNNFGVIHSDLRATNLLVDGDKLHVIDFDDMGYSWYLFDFAAALSFMEQDERAPLLAKSWVKGYEKVTKLSDYEKSLLPTLSIMRRIEITAWCASHFEIPFCQENAANVTENTERLCRDYLNGNYLTSCAG